MTLTSLNPATNEIMKTYEEMDAATIMNVIDAAEDAFRKWQRVDFDGRRVLMNRAAELLRERTAAYARLMALEMGKPIRQGIAEVDKCAWVCQYYAENAPAILKPEPVPTTANVESYVRFDPLGLVLAVMPWNFPFWQVFRFAAPALMAGNGGLLKHASNVPQCALAIEELFRDAGFPEHLFRTLLIGSAPVGQVIEHALVRAVTLTGSEYAGSVVAAQAGKVLKKSVLELGGSDPFIVLADADIELAAGQAVISRMINSGQSCISAKRFIVEASVAEQFEHAVIGHMQRLITGDPLRDDVDAGPLARLDLRDELHRQVQKTLDEGGQLRCGGAPLLGPGCFYHPTVITRVTPDMTAFREETFGPVAPVIRAGDVDEAIELANMSDFGLGASLWTQNLALAHDIAAHLESGNVFINSFVKSDPRLPFGGIKKSGYGRELSHFGIREFTNIKTVWIEKNPIR